MNLLHHLSQLNLFLQYYFCETHLIYQGCFLLFQCLCRTCCLCQGLILSAWALLHSVNTILEGVGKGSLGPLLASVWSWVSRTAECLSSPSSSPIHVMTASCPELFLSLSYVCKDIGKTFFKQMFACIYTFLNSCMTIFIIYIYTI